MTNPTPEEIAARLSVAEDIVPEDYWVKAATVGNMLKPLGKPCHDCAVEWGFYTALSDDLAKQPKEVADAASARWFCHNHSNRACAGNIENVAIVHRYLEQEAGK